MAKSELVIGSDATSATQSFVNAVTYIGGSVTEMNPTRPVAFKISRSGSIGGHGAPYRGTASFVETTGNRTRVMIDLQPQWVFSAFSLAFAIGVISLAGALTGNEDTIMTVSIIVLPVTALMLYLYHQTWPRQVLDRLQAGVHGTVPAFSPAADLPSSPQPAPDTRATPTLADQLEQLGTLRDRKLISEAEFETKRADLIKRL